MIKVVYRNIACSKYDEMNNPLWDRIIEMSKEYKSLEPDILILIESGRGSKGHCWEEIVKIIENETNLKYKGVKRVGTKETALGKSIFINTKTIDLVNFDQYWMNLDNNKIHNFSTNDQLPFDDGPDVITVTIKSLVYLNDEQNRTFTIGVVHLPKSRDKRISMVDWLIQNRYLFQIILGDFNTFPNDGSYIFFHLSLQTLIFQLINYLGGPEMIKKLDQYMIPLLKEDKKPTFRGFPNDIISVNNNDLEHFKDSLIIEKGENETKIIPSGQLDHVYLSDKKLSCKSSICYLTNTSDHASLIVNIYC